MTTYDKPFKTYREQIDLLKSRNLIIENDDFAIHALSTISYYDLINRYQSYFMPDGHNFIDNTSIEQLYSLSMLDKSIQAFILKYSMLIENIFKTKLSYTLSNDFGVDTSTYLAQPKYRESYQNPNGALTFLSVVAECKKTIEDNKIANNPTLYYRDHHNHIPPWILLKNLSFSNSINLFKLLKTAQREKIVEELIPNDNIPPNDRLNFILCSLEAIRLFRNAAAHNLHFTAMRIDETRKLAPTVLAKLLPGGILIQKSNKKVSPKEKPYLKGIYGIMLSMLIYLKTDYLMSEFIIDFLSIFNGANITSQEVKLFLFECYAHISDMPIDITNRFNQYLTSLQQE